MKRAKWLEKEVIKLVNQKCTYTKPTSCTGLKPTTCTAHLERQKRFHSTVKSRTKVLRGFKTAGTAEQLLDGFLLHYNFFRPHMSLKDKTPAEVAGIKSPLTSWTDVVKQNKTSFQQANLRQKTPFGF